MNQTIPNWPLGTLSFLLTRQQPNLTIGDIREAANRMTLDVDLVMRYLEGNGTDLVIATDLIAFFQAKIEDRNDN